MSDNGLILALAGGVGGAKLALGLTRVLPPERLCVVVNTGDDFEHLGLHISPDLDSVMYALAGMASVDRGWGIEGESWTFMEALDRLGGETWFQLGDRDLATHVERSRMLSAGRTLSETTADLARRLGIRHAIVPMSDDAIRTMVRCDGGTLAFQDYFVRRKCEPVVTGFAFDGADTARPAPAFRAAIEHRDLQGIIICPSNPFVSVAPILAVPGVARMLTDRKLPIVAVSPIVGGAAVKGPAAKMMRELGLDVSPAGIARHYGGLIDGLVIDRADQASAGSVEAAGPRALVTGTVMASLDDRIRLARDTLGFVDELAP